MKYTTRWGFVVEVIMHSLLSAVCFKFIWPYSTGLKGGATLLTTLVQSGWTLHAQRLLGGPT